MKSASRIIVWASLVAIALLSLSCGTAREGHQTSASKIPDELPVGIKGYREVFYSTDRSPGESGTFGTEASDDAKLRFGRVIVSIPAVHTRGELERPWRVFSVSLPEDSRKQIVIADRRSLAEDSFFGQVSYAIDTAPEKEAFVFVHGFNVPFDDAVLRTGQLAWDMKFRGPAITYSWPSAGKTSRYVAVLTWQIGPHRI